MKTPRSTAPRKLRPSICTSTIAVAALVLAQVGSLSPSASATTFGPADVPFGTQLSAPLLTDATGLTMNGGGLLLLNSGNTYTGTTTINDGSVSITAASALGADTSAITIAGLPLNGAIFDASRGGGGGNLTVGGGITLSRDLNLRGLGTSGDTGALTNVGNNTFTGAIVTGTGAGTRIVSTAGRATFSGPVSIAGNTTLQFAGYGNTIVSGPIGGSSGSLQKIGSGGGVLELTGNNTYSGTTSIVSGSIRVSDQSNLGTNTSNTAITLSGGALEIRTNAGSFATKGLSNNLGGTVFVDHALGSSVQNHTVVFRNLAVASSSLLTLNGRNGYGVTFNGMTEPTAQQIPAVNNNLNGLLTFNGNFWNHASSIPSVFEVQGNGDTLINGNIQATGAAHTFRKTGFGTVTIMASGTGSNLSGPATINNGTLAINSISALNNSATGPASPVNILVATLAFIGSGAASDYSVAKTVNLAAASGTAGIAANQSGANPVVISSISSAAGSKTLTLAGTNGANNLISGTVANGSAGTVSAAKTGPGTWALSGPNTYGGATTISGGTLKVLANGNNIIPDTSNLVFNTNGGTLELVGQAGVANVETLGQLVPTAGAATLRLTPGAGGSASLVFSTGTAATALGAVNNSSSVNVVASGVGNTVTLTGVPTGFVDPHIYMNGADFAQSNAGVLAAPVYGTTPGYVTSSTVLTNAMHNEITGSFSQGAETIRSLKINGSQILTLTGQLTINSQGLAAGATSAGGIIQTGGSSSINASGISTGSGGNLVIRVDGVADSLTLAAPVVATNGGLTKNGAGTLIIEGTNNQAGQTTINEGAIRLSGTGRLSAVFQPLVIRSNGTLDLNGVDTVFAISSFNGEGTVTNSSAASAVLTVGNNNGAGAFAGVIQDGVGQISVIKQDGGNQTWSGLNTYTGSTRVNSTGIVAVPNLAAGGAPSSIGASSSAASNLVFGGASGAGSTGGISYTGAASISTDRLFTLAGNAANSGGRIQANGANNAAVIFSNTAPIEITGTAAQILTLGGASSGDNRMNPRLVDGAGAAILNVRKDDAGLWILGNSANSYSGTTRITNGMLQADGTTLPSASPLIIGSGTAVSSAVFQSSGNFTRVLGTGPGQVALLGTGSASNGGFAASSAKLNVNLTGGVTWGTANFLPANQAFLLNSSTALSEVDLQSGIDLNGDARQIQVLDNTNTASDVATISGVISGAGASSGVIKTGPGLLNLTGANTYEGNTQIRQGTVNVTSLGNDTGLGASSVGAWGAGSVDLGFNNVSATLDYVGAGETSSRAIRATGTAGNSSVIRSNGTGALILTNVVNAATGTAGKTLVMSGENSGPNEIQSNLADNGGRLILTKTDGGVWVTNAAHTYSGGTNVNSGALGIGVDASGSVGAVVSGPLGTGTLTISFGTLMALNGDRTIINNVAFGNNTFCSFMGENSIIIDAPMIVNNGPSSTFYNNFIAQGTGGKALILNGQFSHNDVNNKTQIFQGSGDTVINGLITQTNTGNLALSLGATGGGLLRIGGSAGPNTYNGPSTLNAGTLILDKVGAIANTGTASILNFNSGTLQATSAANGIITNTTVLGTPSAGSTATVSGNSTIEFTGTVINSGGNRTLINNTAAILIAELVLSGTVNLSESNTPRTLTIGGFGTTVISGLIQNGGAGAGGLTKAGDGTLAITSTANTYTGATRINGGYLGVASLADGGLPSSIGQASSAATNLTLDGGTLSYGGSTVQSTNKLFQIGPGGATIFTSGTGTMNFTGTGAIGVTGTSSSARSLTLEDSLFFSPATINTFSPLIAASSVGVVNVIKNGASTWRLTNANTYTGGTTINYGTLLLANTTGSATGTGPVTINGGTLAGTGTAGGPIIALGGQVSPGASIGTLAAGPLSMNGSASFKLELNTAAAPGAQNDKLNLAGTLTLESAANGGTPLDISELGTGAALPAGTLLPFITFLGSQTGFFSVAGNLITDELEAFIVGLNTFQIDYNNGGNSVALKVVPEPGVVTSLLTGFGLLLGARRRRVSRQV